MVIRSKTGKIVGYGSRDYSRFRRFQLRDNLVSVLKSIISGPYS